MRVTIRDVASRAGFSITTVSLVLNNRNANIPQKTRDIILDAAKELGYRPNQLAVSLITKKTNVLGLIIPDIANSFFAEITKQVDLEANRHGYTIIIGETFNNIKKYNELLQMYVDRQVDGIVVTNSTRLSVADELKNIDFLKKHGIPSMSIDSSIERSDVNSILVDQKLGGYVATKHLLELGHRVIGCMTGPFGVTTSDERVAGYKKALAEYGISFRPELLFEGDYSMARSKDALDHFLKLHCSAVFALNDMMAFGIYRSAYQRNINIPEELSVVGFDDVNIADIVSPGLTTVRQPIDAIAVNAIEILNYMIENKNEQQVGKRVYLEPTLIVRESTASKNR